VNPNIIPKATKKEKINFIMSPPKATCLY